MFGRAPFLFQSRRRSCAGSNLAPPRSSTNGNVGATLVVALGACRRVVVPAQTATSLPPLTHQRQRRCNPCGCPGWSSRGAPTVVNPHTRRPSKGMRREVGRGPSGGMGAAGPRKTSEGGRVGPSRSPRRDILAWVHCSATMQCKQVLPEDATVGRQADLDNHANQLNPNNDAYWQSRGFDGRPGDLDDDGWDDDDGDSHSDDTSPKPRERMRERGCGGPRC